MSIQQKPQHQQHAIKTNTKSLDYSYDLMRNNEDILYHAASLLETAISYNVTLKDTDSSNESKFHQVIGNLDNLLEIVAGDIKKVRIKILSEFGEVNEQAL